MTIVNSIKNAEAITRKEVGRFTGSLHKTWWYKKLTGPLMAQFMEKPHYIHCRPDLPGTPAIYVNGIATDEAEAKKNGEAIAEQIGRPVNVIHNATSFGDSLDTGLRASGYGIDDISECLYDRVWPVAVATRLDTLGETAIGTILGAENRLQGNPTTRQLAYALYHAKGPVSLVTHSQGCIIARNAFFTCQLLSKESKARNNVAWVAAGQPLNRHEVFPEPKKTVRLSSGDDPIVKLIGLNGGGINYNAADHDFRKKYVPRIRSQQLWPTTVEDPGNTDFVVK